MSRILGVLLACLALTGCLVTEEDSSASADSSVDNGSICLSAVALNNSSVRVTFNSPPGMESIRISRNGIPAYESINLDSNEFVDYGLSEGASYVYSCEGSIDGEYVRDPNALIVTTETSTAPNFDGIAALDIDSGDLVASWLGANGATVARFDIFLSTGNEDPFAGSPIHSVTDITLREYRIENLGDELQFNVGVRACTATNICDSNTQELSRTLPNAGAPKDAGITSLEVIDGQIVATLPWDYTVGGVLKRNFYRWAGATGASCPSSFSSYTNSGSTVVADTNNPPSSVVVPFNVFENTKYCIIVRNEDSSGNEDSSLDIEAIEIGDLTPPNFLAGITIGLGTDSESEVVASWSAMQNETENATAGAFSYQVYISSSLYSSTPSDPCALPTPHSVVVAPTSGNTVQVTIDALNPRQKHQVCVVAVDSSGNRSQEQTSTLVVTEDTTAPTFYGIESLSYDNVTASFLVGVTPPLSTDTGNYQITFHRPIGNLTETIIIASGGETAPFSLSIPKSATSLSDNDSIEVRVDACDDAQPIFNAANNCTSTASVRTLVIDDTSPPPNFNGILTVFTSAIQDHAVEVQWNAPLAGDLSEYAGFTIYSVESGALVELDSSNCICGQVSGVPNCVSLPVPSWKCTVDRYATGALLDANRNDYIFHVAAYDHANNYTTLAHTGPGAKNFPGTTSDIVNPTFGNANLELEALGGVKVKFLPGSDNQYTGGGNELEYFIYRKDVSTFTDANNPQTDAEFIFANIAASSLTIESGKFVYLDTAPLVDGTTYFYQVCVQDKVGQRTCQTGPIVAIAIDDTTPPVVTDLKSDKKIGDGGWTVSWTMSDNKTVTGGLSVAVYKGVSAFPATIPGNLTGLGLVGQSSFTDTGSPTLRTAYYTIVISDAAGNQTSVQITDLYDPVVVGSVSPIQTLDFETEIGDTVLGETITINGSGFLGPADNQVKPTVTVGGTACTSVDVVSSTQLTCLAPDKTEGDHSVIVTNFDLQTDSDSFHYRSYCDKAGPETIFGAGNSFSPYKVCNDTHLQELHSSPAAWYKLMSDVDLNGITFNPVASYSGDFNGNGFTIRNWTSPASYDGVSNMGLFQIITGAARIHDLTLQNFTVTGNGDVAVLAGASTVAIDADMEIENVTIVGGTVVASANGAAGFVARVTTKIDLKNIEAYNLDITSGQYSGGVIGYAGYDDQVNINAGDPTATCVVTGQMTGGGSSKGGVVGFFDGSSTQTSNIENCHVNLDISGSSYIGGIVGQTETNVNIKRSVMWGDITATGSSIGGLVGYAHPGTQPFIYIEESAVLSQNITSTNRSVGGIAGLASGDITIVRSFVDDTTIYGDVSGAAWYQYRSSAAGFIGSIRTNNFQLITIQDSYIGSNVEILGPSWITGIFAGGYDDPTINYVHDIQRVLVNGKIGTISNICGAGALASSQVGSHKAGAAGTIVQDNFFNTDTTCYNAGEGGVYEGSGLDPISDANAKVQGTYTNWDFTNVWEMDPLTGYPSLRWEPAIPAAAP